MNKSNYERFPNNLFLPKRTSSGEVIYLAKFSNLYDLYEYLKSNPKINTKIFSSLSSMEGSRAFAGVPYEQAVENLIKYDYDPGYTEFLELQRGLDNCINVPIHEYRTVRSVSGGYLNIPAYLAGDPFCYETYERISKPRFIRINVLLDYISGTTKNQVFNSAIIITNILKALENAGYIIDLNVFSLSYIGNEYMHIIYKVKDYDELLDMRVLYKILCRVEFLRRITFRVQETMDVKEEAWGMTYGKCCSDRTVKRILNLGDDDILFNQPQNMGIYGKELDKDFENAVGYLNIADKIDIEDAKKKFREQVRVLSKKKSK